MKQQDGARRAKGPQIAECSHDDVLTTVTAGLERTVCEKCSHVQIRFVSESVQLFPTVEDLGSSKSVHEEEVVAPRDVQAVERRHRCVVCESDAIFITPFGMACSAHAWDAASDQESDEEDLWIPLLIDRPNARRMMNDMDNGEGEIIDLTWFEE